MWGQPFSVQIFPKYCHNLNQQKYLESVFTDYVQLVPSILFTSSPHPVWIATDSLAILLLQQTVFNSYPNINWKRNWKGENIQIFSSEIILAWENGSQSQNSLISKFQQGLTHSAVICQHRNSWGQKLKDWWHWYSKDSAISFKLTIKFHWLAVLLAGTWDRWLGICRQEELWFEMRKT